MPIFDYYDHDAEAFAARYDALRFEDVHKVLLPFLPKPPAAILDVGAGSGRDVRALVKMGFTVVAVDPVPRLRAGTPNDGVEWVEDALPELRSIVSKTIRFDFILCSAVLMLLRGEEAARSVATMAKLLLPGGKFAVSFRDRNPGEPAELFHSHLPALVLDAAAQAGLSLCDARTLPDVLGRAHHWQSFVFELRIPQSSGGIFDRNST